MADIELVRFLFYPKVLPDDDLKVADLLFLVFRALTANGITPVAILIRLAWHPSKSTAAGRHMPDPKGGHYTFACKDTALAHTDKYRTFHLYTPNRTSYVLKELEGFPVRDDSTLRSNGKPIWPAEPADPEEILEVNVADYLYLMKEGKAEGP